MLTTCCTLTTVFFQLTQELYPESLIIMCKQKQRRSVWQQFFSTLISPDKNSDRWLRWIAGAILSPPSSATIKPTLLSSVQHGCLASKFSSTVSLISASFFSLLHPPTSAIFVFPSSSSTSYPFFMAELLDVPRVPFAPHEGDKWGWPACSFFSQARNAYSKSPPTTPSSLNDCCSPHSTSFLFKESSKCPLMD